MTALLICFADSDFLEPEAPALVVAREPSPVRITRFSHPQTAQMEERAGPVFLIWEQALQRYPSGPQSEKENLCQVPQHGVRITGR